MTMVLLGLVVVLAVRWFLRMRQPASAQPGMQYAGMPAGVEPPRASEPFVSPVSAGGPAAVAATTAPAANVPADFDVEGFLRQAKLNFIRLQAANDRGDMEDIRQFCSPEMAAEKMCIRDSPWVANQAHPNSPDSTRMCCSSASAWKRPPPGCPTPVSADLPMNWRCAYAMPKAASARPSSAS